MNQHDALIHQFYTAFQQGNYTLMQSCYHDDATFSDPVFPNLSCRETRAMWQMLLTSAKDLKVSFTDIKGEANQGTCSWEAWYTFSRTGRPVHNRISAKFQFKDGKIFRHEDSFDLWRWSSQALGFTGILLGWSPIVKNKVQGTARKALDNFLSKNV
jgi:ketosteroid isomerase-like protein